MARLLRTIALASTLQLSCSLGCTQVEEHDGGLFAPFPDGVTGNRDADGMELPPASDFVTEEPPLVVDSGAPPAVVVGDDDSAEEPVTDDAVAEIEPVEAVRPLVPEPITPEPLTSAAPAPLVAEARQVEATPTPSAPVMVVRAEPPTYPAHLEAALLMSAPLSKVALIATIPDATPPRAIVRFPTGEERVVQVGDLLGDNGAKVILISAGSIKLAEVVVDVPDHPTIVTHYLHQSR